MNLRPAAITLLLLTLLCGFVYPLAITGVALLFPHEASDVIGQPFTSPGYFWGRPSAAGYDATASAATNLGPSNAALTKQAADRIAALEAADPGNHAAVPVDLVTASASGLDPHISPAAAYYQAARVARARGVPEAQIRALVAIHVEDRTLGVLGEPRVNVVRLNRALDERFGGSLKP
jgi:K+-transporting ATPase ATPase C chain